MISQTTFMGDGRWLSISANTTIDIGQIRYWSFTNTSGATREITINAATGMPSAKLGLKIHFDVHTTECIIKDSAGNILTIAAGQGGICILALNSSANQQWVGYGKGTFST